jgi:hypothetical protein
MTLTVTTSTYSTAEFGVDQMVIIIALFAAVFLITIKRNVGGRTERHTER